MHGSVTMTIDDCQFTNNSGYAAINWFTSPGKGYLSIGNSTFLGNTLEDINIIGGTYVDGGGNTFG